MRVIFLPILFAILVASTLQDASSITAGSLVSASTPDSQSSASHNLTGLALRQVPPVPAVPPAVVDPALPVPPGVANPAPLVDPALPVAPEVANPAAPIITPTATINPTTPTLTGEDFVTVHWVETWIGGTSQTWVPKTFLFHFELMSPAPQPGVGAIGMGTLTGKTGQTQTIVMIAAASTPVAGWMRGVIAAIGAGAVGIAV